MNKWKRYYKRVQKNKKVRKHTKQVMFWKLLNSLAKPERTK